MVLLLSIFCMPLQWLLHYSHICSSYCVLLPLLKEHCYVTSPLVIISNYSDITFSQAVICKVFEQVLMEMVSDKLILSSLQFDFKANSNCNHAIFTLWVVVKHYCSSGSRLSLCALDICNALDIANICGLLNALIARQFPRIFIKIMMNWLTQCFVRWANCLSSVFVISAEVRQPPVMAPLNWQTLKPLRYQNVGIISYRNRVIGNTAVRGPQCGVWRKRFFLIVNPAPYLQKTNVKRSSAIDGIFAPTENPTCYGATLHNNCIGLPIHCNYQLAHYSGFCRISRSVLNRFQPNLQE